MGKPQGIAPRPDRDDWCVTDALPCDMPVCDAELDAIEAFLMPLVAAILADGEIPVDQPSELAPVPERIHNGHARSRLKDYSHCHDK